MTDPYCDCGAPYPTHVFCETCWEKREAEIERLQAFHDAVVAEIHEHAGNQQDPFAYIGQRKWEAIKAADAAKGTT